jgi:sulfur-carrier protein
MARVWIPALMRNLTQGHESVLVPGHTLREVIDALETMHPGLRARLCLGDAIRPGLSVVINSQISRAGLAETIDDDSEVHFIPAIAGG